MSTTTPPSLNPCPACARGAVDERGVCPQCGRPTQRFTNRAREVMVLANQRALLPRNSTVIEPRHLLVAIALGPQGMGYHALLTCGVEPAQLAADIEGPGAVGAGASFIDDRLPLSAAGRALVNVAVEEAFALRQGWVGTEHLLLALTKSSDDAARNALASRGVTAEKVTAFIHKIAEEMARSAPPSSPAS